MNNNQISAFEFISILLSIILGLGITQILTALSDLLYNHRKVKFYLPHSIWIFFILFLHIQDWFVTYQLRTIPDWSLTELAFILLYPICLFLIAKMLMPTNDDEERFNMKKFYFSQFPTILILMSVSIILSISFNVLLLHKQIVEQGLQFVFLAAVLYLAIHRNAKEFLHYILSFAILIASIIALFLENSL